MSEERIDLARPKTRVLSLDAFRGLTVATMIFVNNVPTSAFTLLRHAPWNGLTLPDAVFPSFIFIVGVSMAFAFASPQAVSRGGIVRFVRRTAVLFGIGVLINALYAAARRSWRFGVNGVLQRIALSQLIAAPFARRAPLVAASAGIVLLAAHSALLLWVPVPGGMAGDLSHPTATMAAYVDRLVFGPQGALDPENLLGTISSAGGMLLGVAVGGLLLRRKRRALLPLVVSGALALVAGIALSPWLPLNKRLWTATFVLIVTGIDTLLLAAGYWWVDGRCHRRSAEWIEPLGRNALALYIGSTLVDGLLLAIILPRGPLYVLIGDAFETTLGAWGSLLFPAVVVAAWYAVALALHRRRLHLSL